MTMTHGEDVSRESDAISSELGEKKSAVIKKLAVYFDLISY